MLSRTFISLLVCNLMANVAHCAPNLLPAEARDTEAQLVKSLRAINENNLGIALSEVNSLLQTNPNFKLAQLVRGDLLMAHAGLIDNFGSAANAPRGAIEGLRDEARARLQRVQTQSDAKLKPRFLWQMDAQQKYALVIDANRSTLFVYENINGEPQYVTDFYVTLGKLGTDKAVQGDQRTPIGVYFVKAALPKNQLSDFYGIGAYPLNYPNEYDHWNGRTGSGIWLHGTPSNTYSRPPRASNGCLVLANDDLKKLEPYLQAGVTPVIIANQMNWSNERDQSDRTTLLQEIEQWRKDWTSLDTGAYLKHYAQNFSSGNMDYPKWVAMKQQVNSSKSWIKVGITNVSVFAYPDQPNLAVVNFEQDYSSNNLSNRMKKRQYWIKQNDRWQIIYEGGA